MSEQLLDTCNKNLQLLIRKENAINTAKKLEDSLNLDQLQLDCRALTKSIIRDLLVYIKQNSFNIKRYHPEKHPLLSRKRKHHHHHSKPKLHPIEITSNKKID